MITLRTLRTLLHDAPISTMRVTNEAAITRAATMLSNSGIQSSLSEIVGEVLIDRANNGLDAHFHDRATGIRLEFTAALAPHINTI